jgi:glycosyltransferase involved in cell wall biosynthesis
MNSFSSVNKMLQISVIIPHLNQEDFLERCLASLADQTIGDVKIEIIVVDNGSRRLPGDVVGRFPGVRLEQELTPGPGPARNKGIQVSSAPVLAFIDADCIADRTG